MNHSGIGNIDDNGNIHLPIEVLSPLSIVNGAEVWGIYYPSTSEKYKGNTKQVKYDLVISPIPFKLWGKVIRIKIRLKQVSRAHEKITENILEQGGSILFSESSRSAHSYDTWTLVVSFDDLGAVEYAEKDKAYLQTKDRMEALSDILTSRCSDVIYKDKCDEVCHTLVHITSFSAMSYFYHMVHKHRNTSQEGKNERVGAYEPFYLECDSNGVLISKDSKLKGILNYINRHQDSIFPSKVFCEVDTNDINVRIAIIPECEENNFFSISLDFSRSGYPANSKGLINYILSRLPLNYTVWRISTVSKKSGSLYEEGHLEFLIKDSNCMPNLLRKKEILSVINAETLPASLQQIDSINIKSSSLNSLFVNNQKYQESNSDEYDVFISYSTKDRDTAQEIHDRLTENNYRCFLADKSIKGGDNFTNKIRDALRGSRELLILYSDNADGSEWVKQEYGAAWVLGMKVVPVLLDMPSSRLPEWLRHKHAYPYGSKFDLYLSELKDRDP